MYIVGNIIFLALSYRSYIFSSVSMSDQKAARGEHENRNGKPRIARHYPVYMLLDKVSTCRRTASKARLQQVPSRLMAALYYQGGLGISILLGLSVKERQ